MLNYVPRTTCPSRDNLYYRNYQYGGYNVAIPIDKTDGWVMPNCVGYAQGRYRELYGDTKVWSDIGNYFSGNAETFFPNAVAHGFKTGQVPKLGAIVCYEGAGEAAGHVCIVEKINLNADKTDIESIITSNSAYNGTEFFMQTVTKADGYLYNKDGSRPLQGFIYQDEEYGNDPTRELTRGFFDSLVENPYEDNKVTLNGWCWNGYDDEAVNVVIKVFRGTKEIGMVVTPANQYRGDLKAAGIGNGNHSFSVGYDYSSLEPGTYTFKAYAYNGIQLVGEHTLIVPEEQKAIYRVQLGAYRLKSNAKRCADRARADGLSVIGKYVTPYYKVQVGAYEVKENSERMLQKVRDLGYTDAFITTEDGQDVEL